MKIIKFNKSNFLTLLLSTPLVFALIFIKSPISYNLGFNFISYALFYLLFYVLLIFQKNNKKINTFSLCFSLICLMTFSISAIYHSKLELFYSAGTIILGILVFSAVDKELFLKVINISTTIIFILLIGAWITFIDSHYNGFPENFYKLANGREIFYGKFSFGLPMKSMLGEKYFRPSSIYDEPGAFSLVIVFIVAMRNALNMSERNSILILLLGLITFSLAHLFFLFFYFIHKLSLKKIVYLFIFSILFLILISLVKIEIFDPFKTLFERLILVSPDDGYIRGNSRRNFIQSSFAMLQSFNYQDLIFGKPGQSRCCQPLEPLLNRGLLGSWPYYFILCLFIYYGAKRKSTVAFAIFLILLQRPEIQSAGTAFLVAALLFVYKLKGSLPKNLTYSSKIQ